jgi:hypothetical protein
MIGEFKMEKCGVCHKDIKDQPCVKANGTCSECNEKLHMESEKRK